MNDAPMALMAAPAAACDLAEDSHDDGGIAPPCFTIPGACSVGPCCLGAGACPDLAPRLEDAGGTSPFST